MGWQASAVMQVNRANPCGDGVTVGGMETTAAATPPAVSAPSHPTAREQYLALLFNGPLVPTDAICVFSGDGTVRLDAALGALRQRIAHWVLLSGGVDNPPHSLTSHAMAKYMVQRGLRPNRIIEDPASQNTHEQAEWLAGFLAERELESVTLVASAYHMPRAMLTVVKSLETRGLTERIAVNPLPAGGVSWWECPASLDVTRFDLLADEFAKIERYTDHVASYQAGIDYLRYWEGG